MRTREMVPARILLLCAATIALAAFPSPRSQAEIACNSIGSSYSLEINANGYNGSINCAAMIANPDGSYSANCEAQFPGNPDDTVKLTCKGRHVTFTRTRPGAFTQNYSGWMHTGSSWEIAGDFSHNSSERTYGWCGRFKPIIK